MTTLFTSTKPCPQWAADALEMFRRYGSNYGVYRDRRGLCSEHVRKGRVYLWTAAEAAKLKEGK